MFESLFLNSSEILRDKIGFIPVLGLVYVISMILFWYESKHVKKDRSSIFDQWFLTSIAMIFWGRVTYIILYWSDFSRWNWFYLPYEKYGDQIYLFRAMPWRLFSIWDGGFLFIPMFLIYIVVGYLYVVHFKKWRWREMMTSLLFSSNFLLGTTLIIYGMYLEQRTITSNGVVIVIGILTAQIFLNGLKRFYRKNLESYVRIGQVITLLYAILDIWFLSYIFLKQEISSLDRYHVYAFIAFGIYMVVMYILDVRKVDSAKGVNMGHGKLPELNRSLRL